MRGLTTNLLNPKALAFYVAVLPTFLDSQSDVLHQSLLLCLVYVLVATSVHIFVVALAGSIQPLLANRNARRAMAYLFAVALIIVAIWFAWSTR